MAGLDDGHVELRVQRRLILGVPLLMRGLHLGEDRGDDGEVGVAAQTRGALGGKPLHVAAEIEVVEDRLVMAAEQADQRGGEGRAQNLGHIDPGAGTRGQKPRRLQSRHGLAQRGARDAKPFGQFPFRRKAFARTQDTLQDQPLDLADDGMGQLLGRDFLIGHGPPRIGQVI